MPSDLKVKGKGSFIVISQRRGGKTKMCLVPVCNITGEKKKKKKERQTILHSGAWRMTRGVSQPEERSCSAVWWHGS